MAETRNQRRIREILEEREPEPDHSLRGQAMERATEERVPRTLTPWEWEHWYAQHGVPERHREVRRTKPWWRRLLARLGAGR